MALYACDPRLHNELAALKPTPGYCVFIDVVNSVALKGEHIAPWCRAMHNLIAPAMNFLRDLQGDSGNMESDTPLLQPTGLLPLKVIGDCIMFYIRKETMPKETFALNIFDALLNMIRVPKKAPSGERLEVHVAVTSCSDVYEVTFMPDTEDFHGKGIDLAARLVKEAGPDEIVMDERFYEEAEGNRRSWVAAGNVRSSADPYMQFEKVEGHWTRNFKGFKEPLRIYKWGDALARRQPSSPAQGAPSK